MSKHPFDLTSKMNRLVTGLLEKRIIPFLGAGISRQATYTGDGENLKDLADTGSMIRRVAEAIYYNYKFPKSARAEWSRSCMNISECGLLRESLDHVCEMYLWMTGNGEGAQDLVEVLHIKDFVHMEPTPAHRYIAYLAREGLIDEIITTNYDCCMEKAFSETIPCHYTEPSPAFVICNLQSFQSHGARRSQEFKGRSQPCIKIYKINGCSRSLKNGDITPQDILLTERQLQKWRVRYWARDLFRDRLRSRAVIFSGFGSDEPQVRHTMLQVIEEFGAPENTNTPTWWENPNAPFVSAFTTHLQFNQIQVLNSYACAYNKFPSSQEVRANAFTGKDARSLGWDKDTLPADFFWMRVYQATFWQLFKKACNPKSPACLYLSSVTNLAQTLLQELLAWLCPEENLQSLFGRYPQCLEIVHNQADDRESCWVHPLSRWIWNSSCSPGNDNVPKGWYAPLTENPIIIPVLFSLIYLLIVDNNNISWEEIINDIWAQNGFFIISAKIDVGTIFSQPILIANPDNILTDNQTIELPTQFYNVPLIQLVLDTNHRFQPRRIRIKVKEHGNSSEKMCFQNVYQIPLHTLLSNSLNYRSKSLPQLKKAFRQAIWDASVVVKRNRLHLKERAIIVG